MAGQIGINISSRVTMDTSQAKNEFKSFADNMQNAKFSPIEPSKTPPLINNSNPNESLIQADDKIKSINEKLNTQKDSISSVVDALNNFQKTVVKLNDTMGTNKPSIRPNLPDATPSNNKGLAQIDKSDLIKGILQVERNVPQNVSTAMTGNVMGAGMAALSGGSSILTSLIGSIGLAPLLGITAGAAAVLGTAKVAQKSEENYEKALPGIDRLLSAFSENPNEHDTKVNSSLGLAYRNVVLDKNIDTGLDNNEFVNLVSNLGKYGVTDASNAALMTQQAAKYARFTNGDTSDIAQYLGVISRYGSKNPIEDLNYAYGAARASGLERNQFPEFLNSIQRVIEDAVAKGYTKSTKEVADTVAMFGKLSGDNESWKGEQGVNRLMQINSGLESATSLSSVSDLIAYQALKGKGENVVAGGNWINDMIYMEKGLNKDNFKSIADQIKNTYGNDVESQVMAWKQISGLNYTGAAELYNMSLKDTDPQQIEERINQLKTDPNMTSDTTRLANSVSSIEKNLSNMGKNVFNVKIVGTQTIEDLLTVIAGNSLNKSKKNLYNSGIQKLFGVSEAKEKKEFTKEFNELWKGTGNAQEKLNMLEVLGSMNDLTESERKYFNENNLNDSIVFSSPDEFISSMEKQLKAAKEGAANYVWPKNVTQEEVDEIASISPIVNENAREVAANNKYLQEHPEFAKVQGGEIDVMPGEKAANTVVKNALTQSLTYLAQNEATMPANIESMVKDLGDNGTLDSYHDQNEGLKVLLQLILSEIQRKFTGDNSTDAIIEYLNSGINVFSTPQ